MWLIQTGEPIRGIDGDVRRFRLGMLADALADVGHQVVWWSSTFSHVQKRYRYSQGRVIETRHGLQVRLLHARPGYARNISLARVLNQRSAARRFAAESAAMERPSCIFCCLPTIEMAAQAVRYGREYGVPVIVDVRDRWPDVYAYAVPRVLRGAARVLLASQFRKTSQLLKQATAISAVSHTYLKWALAYAERSAGPLDAVFPLGYSRPRFTGAEVATETGRLRRRLGLEDGDLVVVFVGTFGASYDLTTVLEAAGRLSAEKRWRVKFVLAGDGDHASMIRGQASGLPNVILPGWLDERELSALCLCATVGLVPYKSDATQSLPNKPFEYMAAGLPLLSSLKGELATLIEGEEIGLNYRAGDAVSLVAGIEHLAADVPGSRRMGDRARSLFERRYDERVIYPQLADYVASIASAATRRPCGRSLVGGSDRPNGRASLENDATQAVNVSGRMEGAGR